MKLVNVNLFSPQRATRCSIRFPHPQCLWSDTKSFSFFFLSILFTYCLYSKISFMADNIYFYGCFTGVNVKTYILATLRCNKKNYTQHKGRAADS